MKEATQETPSSQKTKGIPGELSYAEYDIGNAVVQIDFKQQLVNIGKWAT